MTCCWSSSILSSTERGQTDILILIQQKILSLFEIVIILIKGKIYNRLLIAWMRLFFLKSEENQECEYIALSWLLIVIFLLECMFLFKKNECYILLWILAWNSFFNDEKKSCFLRNKMILYFCKSQKFISEVILKEKFMISFLFWLRSRSFFFFKVETNRPDLWFFFKMKFLSVKSFSNLEKSKKDSSGSSEILKKKIKCDFFIRSKIHKILEELILVK